MPIERVSQGFKDISMTFQSNPLNDDLIAIKNENAIARSLRNIVFTTPGEKFFNQSFGSRISESLFENIDEITATIIVDEIRQSIDNYEPRVEVDDVGHLQIDVVSSALPSGGATAANQATIIGHVDGIETSVAKKIHDFFHN